MTALRVLAADDELLARRRLERLLREIEGVELLAVVESGAQVLARLEEDDCDLLVLDVQMPGLTGIEVGRSLPDDGPAVIFATAHPEHAVDAFDVGAIDYLLKPIDPLRLRRAVERARRLLLPPSTPAGRLAVETRAGVLMLDPARVTHVEIEGALTAIASLDHGRLFTDESIASLQQKLEGFERVHRKALLNLARVQRFEPLPSGGYTAHLAGDASVPVSRAVARRLRRRLGL